MAEEERDRKWTVLRLRGLRKRWIVNTILPVLVLLMLLVTLVSVGVSTYYYSSMENGLMKQAEAMSSAFNDYFMNSYSEYNQMATQAVDTYEDKSRIELQFIGSTGRIQMSTSGLTAGSSPGTSDITRAITNQEITPFQGRDPETGEKIMAVSAPLLFNGRVAGDVHEAGGPADCPGGLYHSGGGRHLHGPGADLQPAVHQQRGGAGGRGV